MEASSWQQMHNTLGKFLGLNCYQSFQLGSACEAICSGSYGLLPSLPQGRACLPSLPLLSASVLLLLLCCHHTLLPADSGFFAFHQGPKALSSPGTLQLFSLTGTAKASCLIEQWPGSQPLQHAGTLNYLAETRGNLINSFL